jgi:hypothetical protein
MNHEWISPLLTGRKLDGRDFSQVTDLEYQTEGWRKVIVSGK